MHVSIHWTLFDGAGLTTMTRFSVRGFVRTIDGSSTIPYESLVDLLRVQQRVEE